MIEALEGCPTNILRLTSVRYLIKSFSISLNRISALVPYLRHLRFKTIITIQQ